MIISYHDYKEKKDSYDFLIHKGYSFAVIIDEEVKDDLVMFNIFSYILVENPDDETLQTLIRNAQINILVTAQSTGLKLKLLNALFNGRYCVVNDKMVEGLDVNDLCYVANNAMEIKTIVSDLMTKPFVEEQVAIRKSRMEAFYNSSHSTDRLVELLG